MGRKAEYANSSDKREEERRGGEGRRVIGKERIKGGGAGVEVKEEKIREEERIKF